MLTDRNYEEAAEVLPYAVDVPDHSIKVLLQRDGWFLREIWRIEEAGGVWPPRPFAERHFAIVTQPATGNGHYVVMEEDGTVLDPLTDALRRLNEWEVCSSVCGLITRATRPSSPPSLIGFTPESDCHGFDPPPIDRDWPTPLAEGGYIHCGCSVTSRSALASPPNSRPASAVN